MEGKRKKKFRNGRKFVFDFNCLFNALANQVLVRNN